jgi:transaldolase
VQCNALRSLLVVDLDSDALTLFEKLEVEDLQMAADVLRPVYDQTEGADGFVSIEVSPRLAYDTAGSIEEARRLWKAVNRPNLMVKIPSTVQGFQAAFHNCSAGMSFFVLAPKKSRGTW